jgi:hypothetical protein
MRFPYSPHLIKKISSEFYYYGHDEVGDLGVTETPSGDTQLRPYVKDPVELNRDIAAQVAAAHPFIAFWSRFCARMTSGKMSFSRAGVQIRDSASSGKALRFSAPKERGRSRNSAQVESTLCGITAMNLSVSSG